MALVGFRSQRANPPSRFAKIMNEGLGITESVRADATLRAVDDGDAPRSTALGEDRLRSLFTRLAPGVRTSASRR